MEDRYLRQIALPEVGAEGQRRLARASVLVVGCGALGTNAAEVLARAGVGRLVLVDSDCLEPHNLQRQALAVEDDVGRPKATATADALARVNSEIRLEAHVARLDGGNAERLLDGMDLVVDGLDNLPARYALNDACVKRGLPWVFAAVAGTCGMTMPILPRRGPCLRCLLPYPPPPEEVLTAATSGILPGLPRAVAAIEATWAMRLLLDVDCLPVLLLTVDLWQASYSVEQVVRSERCPCCGEGRFEFLE
jgi:adenylyltransferase/sulfurtransferase